MGTVAVVIVTVKMKNDGTVEMIDIIIMRIIIAVTAQITMSDAPAIVKITKMTKTTKTKIITLGSIMTITMIIITGAGDIIDLEDIMAVGIEDRPSFNHLPSGMYVFESPID